MLQLTVKPPLSFQWNRQPPQWTLSAAPSSQSSAPVRDFPFVIGRYNDCQLVLPESAELQNTTSRWHCYITKKDGRYFLADGSFAGIPETGEKKASVSGTFRNGRRLTGPEELADGDTIAVGPWNFKVGMPVERRVDIDPILTTAQTASRTTLKGGSKRSQTGYKKIFDLLTKLASFNNSDNALTHILDFASQNIPPAEVLAILLESGGSRPTVRLAWRKGRGWLFDFNFSSSLLERLHVNEPFLLAPVIADQTASQRSENITSALLTPLGSGSGRLGVLYMDNRGRGGSFTEDDLYLAATLGSLISLYLMTEQQLFLGRLEDNLKQYFSANVVRQLVKEAGAGKLPELAVSERTASILFVDIQGFSEFCHLHAPGEVSALLSQYFMLMSECIHHHGGYVDKFIGDAVMGVFEAPDGPGAPEGSSSPLHAARAARDMIRFWRNWSGLQHAKPMPLRIGVDTGKVVIGNVGFSGRMEYTAIGDAVNLASRLQKLAPPDSAAMTEKTAALVQKEFPCSPGGEHAIKGFGLFKILNFKV